MDLHGCLAFLRGYSPDEFREEFDNELARKNINISLVLVPFIIFFEIFNIIRVLFISSAGLATANNRSYFYLYVFLLVLSVLELIISLIYKNKKGRAASGLVILCSFLFGLAVCLWSTGISLLDLGRGNGVSVYVITTISISVLYYLRPWQFIAMFVLNQIAFIIGYSFVSDMPLYNTGEIINTTVIMFVSIVMSFNRYHNKYIDSKNRYVILTQNKKISEINNELNKLVVTDTLTGMFNRRYLSDVLPARWDCIEDTDMLISAIMFDIDNFKSYNDNFGHQAGDECIKEVSKIMARYTNDDNDYLIRYGGEEFAVIMFDCEAGRAFQIAEKIRTGIEELNLYIDETNQYITMSGGVYSGKASKEDGIDIFLERADEALYLAKRSGKNRNLAYSADMLRR